MHSLRQSSDAGGRLQCPWPECEHTFLWPYNLGKPLAECVYYNATESALVAKEKCVHVSFEKNVNFRDSGVNSFHYTAIYMLLKISGI